MEGYSRKDEGCPQLLDLIPRDRDWLAERGCSSGEKTRHGLEKKLELSLGPPGGENWTNTNNPPYFSSKNAVLKSFLHLQPSAEKKPFSSPAPPPPATTHVPNSSTTAQKRTAPAPVVGWPPIRSFRKSIANGNSSKLPSESSPSKDCSPKSSAENSPRTPFVKINMDGIPIGRKVDLKAYDSYEKLSYAVDELFRGLLAAQRDCCDDGQKGIGRLLDGSGEYTLVYEDNEGDRMLVGDVPWDMFVLSVKRLRVLKSSELPKLSRGSKQGRLHK